MGLLALVQGATKPDFLPASDTRNRIGGGRTRTTACCDRTLEHHWPAWLSHLKQAQRTEVLGYDLGHLDNCTHRSPILERLGRDYRPDCGQLRRDTASQ